MSLKQLTTLFAVVFASQVLASAAFSDDGDTSKKISVFLYFNSGGYAVNYVEVHWKNPGEIQGTYRRWGGDLTIGQGFCLNLDKVDAIQDGAEVWMKFKISGGDKENCRDKGGTLYYKSGKKTSNLARFWSKGTTLNGNRCRVGKPPTSSRVSGGSGNCNYTTYPY